MPKSRFRSSDDPLARAASLRRGRSRTSAKPSPLHRPRVPQKTEISLVPLGRSEPDAKRPIRTAWRPLGERARRKDRLREPGIEANPDTVHRRTFEPRSEPRTLRPLRGSPRSRRTPIDPAAGPSNRGANPAPSGPFAALHDRSEPRPIQPQDLSPRCRSIRSRPFRDRASERTPIPEPPDPCKGRSPRANPFRERRSGRSRPAVRLLDVARGAGPSLRFRRVSPGRSPKAPAGGPAVLSSMRGDSPTPSRRHVASPRLVLADQPRLCRLLPTHRDRRLALSIPPPGKAPSRPAFPRNPPSF